MARSATVTALSPLKSERPRYRPKRSPANDDRSATVTPPVLFSSGAPTVRLPIGTPSACTVAQPARAPAGLPPLLLAPPATRKVATPAAFVTAVTVFAAQLNSAPG